MSGNVAYPSGKLGLLYYGTAGGNATTVVDDINDVKINQSVEKYTQRARRYNVSRNITSIFNVSVDVSMDWNGNDTGQLALRTAFISQTALAIAAHDQSGGKSTSGDFNVTKFDHAQPITDGQKIDLTLDPAATNATGVSLGNITFSA